MGMISVEGAASYLKIPVSSVYRLVRNKQAGFPGVKIGKHWRFRLEEIDRWVDAQREKG